MTTLRIEAPTDAQLAYIAGLCDERGLELPPAVHSKTEASEIIEAILQRQYDPAYHAPNPSMGYDDFAPDDSDVPF